DRNVTGVQTCALPISITSYDYDAPIAEDGSPTEKFEALQRVIRTHRGLPAEPVPRRRPAPELSVCEPSAVVPLWSLVDACLRWRSEERRVGRECRTWW